MTAIREIRLAPPEVRDDHVTFRWSVTPSSPVYRRTSFTLRFPPSVELARVPAALWWRVGLIALHGQWPLLAPCRVVLPITLAPGEAETWLRLTDATAAMLADQAGRAPSDAIREIELVESGPPAPPQAAATTADERLVASCFSGGRDSLTQAALLQELGATPLLVTVTSPREGSFEHSTDRRRHVLDETARRRNLELVEVEADLRGAWNNGAVAGTHHIGVNETSDTLLFLAVAVAVAAARGAERVCQASEAEVQETVRDGGRIVPHRHVMYAASTHATLDALLAPHGVRIGGLTAPLRQFQVQRLLSTRYADLRDLQYSCWELGPDEAACSRCSACRTIAFNLLADGVAPRTASIDLARLLVAQQGWIPHDRARRRTLVAANAGADGDDQLLRALGRITPQDIGAVLAADGVSGTPTGEALAAYTALRDRLSEEIAAAPPEPGYRAGYLELLPESWRDGLRAIFDETFTREPDAAHAALLERSRALITWTTAPLRRPQVGRPPQPRRADDVPIRASMLPTSPEPAPLTDAQLDAVRHVLPGLEPPLAAPADGRTLPVAGTVLDGNELAYVTDCVTSGWVSSAGPYVARFEEAFARATGCAHAVSCSSGTAALHLMLAAAGVGPGDEVVVPAFTMIATANAVGYVGATPVFVDSDANTWNIDADGVRAAIGPRTRAIVGVHTYGEPFEADVLEEVAHHNGVLLLEDAAEAHGATLRGRPVGSLGAAASFSFSGSRILTTGEGGMVTTNDADVAAVARELRDHSFSPERHLWHRFRAFNYRMTNLQAALGLAQVERLEQLVRLRRTVADRYRAALADVPGIVTAPRNPDGGGVHWVFGILVEDAFGIARDDLRRALAAEGIETRTFFVPLHLQPAYLRDNEGRRLPVAERLSARGLYLPSSPTLTDAEIERVASAVRRAQGTGAGERSPRPA